MHKLAARQYLKSIGDKYFVPTPDYLEWVDVNCLDIAIKRKPKWIWQDTKYFYDHMNINDLIDSPLTGDMSTYLTKPEPITPNYSWSSKHDINSKIGGSIASLISLDLSSSDVMSVSIDMSGVMKQSIDYHAVTEALKSKKMNLNSDYIRRIANNKHYSICLVTQYLYITTKAAMKLSINWDFTEKADEKCTPKVSLNEDEKIQFEKTKSIDFDVGTRLAFDLAELHINADGSFELLKRTDKSLKRPAIEILADINKGLPNYCAHMTNTFDVPDDVNRGNVPMSRNKCRHLLDNDDIRNVTIELLEIAIYDKAVLKLLDSFILATQDESMVDLSIFKENQIWINKLSKLLKFIGVDSEIAITTKIYSNTLNRNLIGQMLVTIEAIYHLELPHLQNLLNIIREGNAELMTLFFRYLHNYDKDDVPSCDKLFQDGKYKLLLLTVGVTENNTKLNRYFEPIFILLHGV